MILLLTNETQSTLRVTAEVTKVVLSSIGVQGVRGEQGAQGDPGEQGAQGDPVDTTNLTLDGGYF